MEAFLSSICRPAQAKAPRRHQAAIPNHYRLHVRRGGSDEALRPRLQRRGDESISLSKLATLLAITGEPLFADFATLRFVQQYLYTHRVEELAPGVYRYWPEHAKLGENQAGHISRQGDRWAKAELRDVHPDPERQYLVKGFGSKALDSLPRPLKHIFILQKREGWTNRDLAETPAHYPGKRKISNLSGASKTAPACSRSVENRIYCDSRLKRGEVRLSSQSAPPHQNFTM